MKLVVFFATFENSLFPVLQTEREADKENLDKSKVQLLADIDSLMGGRAAEEFIFGKDKIGVGESSQLFTCKM